MAAGRPRENASFAGAPALMTCVVVSAAAWRRENHL